MVDTSDHSWRAFTSGSEGVNFLPGADKDLLNIWVDVQ
jgi:hypothetical protein